MYKLFILILLFNPGISYKNTQLKDNGIYITSNDFLNKDLKMPFNHHEGLKYTHINKRVISIETANSNYKFYSNEIWGYRHNKEDWRILNQVFYRIDYVGKICVYAEPGDAVTSIPDLNYFSVDLNSPIIELSKKNLEVVYHSDTAFVRKIKSLPITASIFKWDKQKHRYKFIDWLSE